MALEAGQHFPALELSNLDGATSSVTAWRGHKVILHVFASW